MTDLIKRNNKAKLQTKNSPKITIAALINNIRYEEVKQQKEPTSFIELFEKANRNIGQEQEIVFKDCDPNRINRDQL